MAGDEHFHALAATGLGFESLCPIEFTIRPIKKIPIRLALEDLHDQVSTRSKQYTRTGQEFVAKSYGTMMVAERVTGGVRSHVRHDHIEGPSPKIFKGDLAEITLDQLNVGRQCRRIDDLEIDAHHLALWPHPLGGNLAPGTRGSAAVENPVTSGNHLSPLIKLQKLVGGARAVALTLGFLEVMILNIPHVGLCPRSGFEDPGPVFGGMIDDRDPDVIEGGSKRDRVVSITNQAHEL